MLVVNTNVWVVSLGTGADLTKLQVVNIYLQPGTYRIDYVRAE